MKQAISRCFLVGGQLYQPQVATSTPCALLTPRLMSMAPAKLTQVPSALPVRS